MNVVCILDNGFEELEALGTIDILRRGNIHVDIISIKNEDSVIGSHGIEIKNMKPFYPEIIKSYDALFIPGGPHYQSLERNEEFLNIIKYFMNSNKKVGAICAAPTILGHLGLLNGKKYTCFNSMNEDFGGTFIDKYYVVDGNLITGKGPMATIDFALGFVQLLVGSDVSESIKKESFYYNR